MTVLDLFAGAGGWDVALRALGHEVLGVEIDETCCATRAAAGFQTEPVDVRAWAEAAGVSSAGPYVGPLCFEGIVASPPCQAFSRGGHRRGVADPRGSLVLEPLRLALALRPRWLAFEQVSEVLPFWRSALSSLESAGYAGYATLLRAETFGLPQARTRAILVAALAPAHLLKHPPATHASYAPSETQTTLLPSPVGWASALGLEAAHVALATGMDWRPDGSSQMRLGAFPAPTVGTKSLSQWDVVPRGETRQSATARRPLTVSELSVLQGFPADYPWQGTATQIARQIGNAIPPPLALAVLTAIPCLRWGA